MKKLLKSMFVLLLVAGLSTAATDSFFSDTEESTGNLLKAGAIDLRVDSEGHYNGYECVKNKWQICEEVTSDVNQLTNGSFEDPEVTNPAKWQLFNSIPGWTIGWESTETTFGSASRPNPALQEYHEGVNGWTAHHGNQYAELDSDWDGPSGSLSGEPALVKIYQDVATPIGNKYRLSFAFSARPGTPSTNNVLKLRINGVETVYSSSGVGDANNVWEVFTQEFTATTNPTRIEFAGGGSPDSLGVFLDNARLVKLQLKCTPSEEFTQECNSTWDLTDLGPRNKFFSFEDLKPGDYGENTISLHVTNNDSLACMYFDDYSDDDLLPALTEPEDEDPDENNLVGVGEGELGTNIYFYSWHDDGDNIFELGETPITESPVLADNFLDDEAYLIGPVASGVTKYVGLSWCFGDMSVVGNTISCNGSSDTQNEAQTDAIYSTVGFYVEQARNNPDFTCKVPGNEPV